MSMQTNKKLTATLPCDDKITNNRNAKRKNAKNKVINNQRSVLDYFPRRSSSDDNVADEIEKGNFLFQYMYTYTYICTYIIAWFFYRFR